MNADEARRLSEHKIQFYRLILQWVGSSLKSVKKCQLNTLVGGRAVRIEALQIGALYVHHHLSISIARSQLLFHYDSFLTSAKLKPFATTFLHQTDRSCQKQCESLSVIHAKRKGTLFNNRSYTLIVGCI